MASPPLRARVMDSLYRNLEAPTDPLLWDRRFFRYLEALPRGARILDLGAGDRRNRVPGAILVDIQRNPQLHAVADGHHLPFRNEVFDGVLCNAVLEHVPHPHRVAAEIVRVLRPGGWAVIQAPFLEVIHHHPHDYYRYTIEGLRALFEDLEEIEAGISAGPSQAFADFVREYVPLLFRRTAFYHPLRMVMSWLVTPVRLFDRHLQKNMISPPSDRALDRAYYFVGRKPPIPERAT